MKLETYVKKETEIKTINVYVKISDRFSGTIKNSEWETVCDIEDSYVPDFFPWEHYGDYLILDIDIKTWCILNRKTPSIAQMKEFIKNNQPDIED